MRLHLAHLSTEECWTRLSSATMGRVGITVGALPIILPVFFGVVEQSVVFRTATGTKLSAATAGTVVAFEADELLPGDDEGWSVVVQGIAREVTDTDELLRARTLPLPAVTAEGRCDRFVAVAARTITGRLVQFGPVGPSALAKPGRNN